MNLGFRFKTFIVIGMLIVVSALHGCMQVNTVSTSYSDRMIGSLSSRLIRKNQVLGNPIYIRIFKEERELEVWMKNSRGKYERFGVYPICQYSGQLGPKFYEGDLQAPEGFYAVSRNGMKPDSQYHRAFNLGFPNVFDRAHHRTGRHLMVHGDCRSIGCYAMTDLQIAEVYQLADAALKKGQSYFRVHAFPFRMSNARMSKVKYHRHYDFWTQLKAGYDAFEAYHKPPNMEVIKGRYVLR